MKKKKKVFIALILLLLIIIISTIGLFAFLKTEKIAFYIQGKEATELSKEVEYQDTIDYSPKAIKLSAKRNNVNITNEIKYKKVKIDKLKTYPITYQVGDTKFMYKMKVVDTTAPILTGESTVTLKQGETFDQAILNLKAIDNFDKDISDQITCKDTVDTSIPKEYPLLYTVKDSSGNTSKLEVMVIVEAKEIVNNETNQANSAGSSNSQPSGINIVSNPNDITVMINKQNKLPDGWAPSDLTSIGNNHYLRYEAAISLNQMRQDAMNSGIPFNVVSSYRTQAYQANLYNNYYANDPINAPFYSALPRTSEHELGLAIDVSYDYALHDDLQNSSLGQWLAAHAHEYGWIMRYPYGKTNITGYVFEAWHYRYVGVNLATALRNSGLTMEEYY